MNLFEGRLNESGTVLKAGGFEIDLPAALSEFGGAYRRALVTVGIRPEDLVPCAPREAWFSGAADFVEDLGSDRFVHISCRHLRLVARLPARFPIQRGDTVNLKSDFKRVHLFHEEQRINLAPL
jgi:ABC-type sugar transport system ATPase subunit